LSVALVVVAGCASDGAATGEAAASVWLVGDSISVSTRPGLEAAIPGIVVDAAEGRQFSAAPSILDSMLASAPAPDVVVVALGTNGPVDRADMDAVVDLAGDAEVMFVNVRVPRPWEPVSNGEIERAADVYGATVIDWKTVADADPGLLGNDGYHLSAEGIAAWVDLVASTVSR
jgi:hypothetical protein